MNSFTKKNDVLVIPNHNGNTIVVRKDNDWYSDTIYAKYPPKKWQVLDVVKLQKDYKLQLLLDKKMLDRQGSVAYSNRVLIKGEELLKLISKELMKYDN